MKCRCCNTPIVPVFSLGRMPLVNSFLKKNEIPKEKKYALAIGFCPQCYLVQLMKSVDPAVLFRKYLYFSSTSSFFLQHCQDTASRLIPRFRLSEKSLVFEIASNDGAQLQAFKEKGVPVLGIDPAKNIAAAANSRGIETIPAFFNERTAKKLSGERHIKADLIFGANVLAHVPGINDFLKGVRILLTPHGTAVFESPYIHGLFENKFDTIYHEHVFYYSLLALSNVFRHNNLELYDVEFTPMQGGSFRIYVSHPNAFPKTPTLLAAIKKEKKLGYTNTATYKKIAGNVSHLKKMLITHIKKLKKEGKTIAAYGAPAKGVVLMNYFGIGKKYIDFIVDKAVQKQGLYVPGIHMKIIPPGEIFRRKPDYLIILCWNIADEVMQELNIYRRHGGKFIIPIPALKTLS